MNKSMSNILKILVLLAFAVSVNASFFADTVHTVRVYFDDPGYWTSLLATHDTEEYMRCRVVIDVSDTIENVGIRLKGNSSFGHPGRKKPFHLKFDEYIDDIDYRGNDRLTFNNGFKDPTFIREKLASEAFHGLGVPCPRVTWSTVYYNDEYWGFYVVVDPIDKNALSRFFGENDANLYKGDPNGTLEWLGSLDSPYRSRYEKSTNEDEDDWNDLIELCDFVNNTRDEDFVRIGTKFDYYGFARMWAANTFLVNLDSYQGSGHNYYLYFDSSNIGRYIVWDINEAFGVFSIGMTSSAMRTMAIDWHQTNRPLAQRLFEDMPEFRSLVEMAIAELLETTLEYSRFSARVTELADLVRPYVYADPNKMFTNANFETNLDNDIGGGPPPSSSAPGLRSFIRDRGAYLAGIIGEHSPVDVSGAVLVNEVMASNGETIADEMGDFNDWFELFNPADTTVDISNWWVTDDPTEPRKWSFPAGTTLPPHGYLLVWADGEPEEGQFHTSFKLNTAGESVALFASDILGVGLCDEITWVDMPRDSSYGRFPNGGSSWMICLLATPGAENIWTAVADAVKMPSTMALRAYPNPFNSSTKIEIEGGMLPATVEIFDISGRRIADLGNSVNDGNKSVTTDPMKAQHHDIYEYTWSPKADISSGLYLIRATRGDGSICVSRLILMK